MKRKTLKRCKQKDLLRLAKWLNLNTDACVTHDDLVEMIYWSILFV